MLRIVYALFENKNNSFKALMGGKIRVGICKYINDLYLEGDYHSILQQRKE